MNLVASTCLHLLIILFSTITFGFAQTGKGTLKGTIYDDLRQPVAGISVALSNTTLGSATDLKGEFLIKNVPAGKYDLVVSGVGYTAIKQNVDVTDNQTVNLELELNIATQQLEEIIVNAAGNRSYTETISTIGSRTATPLRDIPQSIQVLSQQLLQDRQVFALQESIRNVAGVNQHGGYNDFVMRGFRTGPGNFAVNGQRLGSTYYTPQVTYNLERIEVLRGPASVLYGTANPGGVINVSTKLPQSQAKRNIQLTYGSFDSFRGVGDATGKLSSDGKLLYRFILGYENTGSFQDFVRTKNYFINPSFTYRPSSETSVTLTASYLHQNQQGGGWYNRGIMAPEGNYNALPINWTHHEKEDKMHDYIASVQLLASHQLSSKFSVHLLGRYSYYDFLQTYHHVRWNSYNPENGTIRREYRDFNDFNHDYFLNAYSVYKFQTGTIAHTLLAGIDYGSTNRKYDAKYARTGVPSLNIFNPEYGLGNVSSYIRDGFNGTFDQGIRLLGGYIQNQIEFTPQLKAVLGLRYDTYQDQNTSVDRQPQVTDPNSPISVSEDASDATAFVPRAGIVYQPVPAISLYGSYTQSFEPQYSNFPGAGGPFEPMRGKQWESGIKGEFLNNRLVSTLAFYQIKQVNMLTADPTDPDRQVAGNEATSKGVEVSVLGQISSAFNITANYSYNESRITKSPQIEEANLNPWFMNAPNHQGNLWAVYTLEKGLLKGLGIGGGMYATGKRYGNYPGFSVPGFHTFDALLKYSRQGITLAANLYNLTDKRYISSTFNNRDSIFPGAPRNFRFSIGYSF